VQKRRELQELEQQIRRRMDSRVSVEAKYQERSQRNQGIIADLTKQIAEATNIINKNQSDNGDLQAQIDEKEAIVAERDAEIARLRD